MHDQLPASTHIYRLLYSSEVLIIPKSAEDEEEQHATTPAPPTPAAAAAAAAVGSWLRARVCVCVRALALTCLTRDYVVMTCTTTGWRSQIDATDRRAVSTETTTASCLLGAGWVTPVTGSPFPSPTPPSQKELYVSFLLLLLWCRYKHLATRKETTLKLGQISCATVIVGR